MLIKVGKKTKNQAEDVIDSDIRWADIVNHEEDTGVRVKWRTWVADPKYFGEGEGEEKKIRLKYSLI